MGHDSMTVQMIGTEFPCYTGLREACWARPYEDLLDRLADKIGMEHARVAFALIGCDIQTQTQARLMSALLRAYGDDLVRLSMPQPPEGVHLRRGG
jgi:hypothetical protein